MAERSIVIVGGGLSSARVVSAYREAGGEDEEARGRKGDPVEGATVDVAFPAGPQPPEQVVLVPRHTRSVPATHAPNPAQNPAQIRH